MEFLQKLWSTVVTWFIDERGWVSILSVIAVAIVGIILVKVIEAIARKIIGRSRIKGLAGNFVLTILKILLYFAYVIAIMKTLKLDTSSLVAVLASCTLALSLALQTTLSNFASGMILVSNHPFKEGDFVEVGGISGVVRELSLFSTKICTGDNKVITVPNSNVAGSEIINYSTEAKRRVRRIRRPSSLKRLVGSPTQRMMPSAISALPPYGSAIPWSGAYATAFMVKSRRSRSSSRFLVKLTSPG